MAKIEWHMKAKQLFAGYVENANIEFGRKTACRWQSERKAIEGRLEHYPSSYPPEELLLGEKPLHRRCHMMNRRFKLIYFYDDAKDVVHIVDIWDTLSNPTALIRRIK